MSNNQKLYCSNQEEFLAYNQYKAINPKKYGIIFLGGFMSDMNGTKASALAKFAINKDIDFIRFDYFGHGNSSRKFINCTIGDWLDNTLNIIDKLTGNKQQILIGSSMGGWIMLLAALKRPEKISHMIGLAAAPDFTEELIWDNMSLKQKRLIELQGQVEFKNDFAQSSYPISKKLINEARTHLLLKKDINITKPITLLHGMKDLDVPYHTSIRIAENINSESAKVILLKNSTHRLSDPHELNLVYDLILQAMQN